MTNAEKDIQEVINDGEMLLYFEMECGTMNLQLSANLSS